MTERLQAVRGDVGKVAPVQPECLRDIVDILMSIDDETLKEVYYFVQGYAGRAL